MACGCIEPCSCEGADTKPTKFGVEDLTLGCGTETQIRGCQKLEITQLNASHIVYCPNGSSIEDYITKIRELFPYIECGIGIPTLNFGEWSDAEIVAEVNSCAVGLPGEVTQRVPFNYGDLTIHDGCVWISLIDNNLSEPSPQSQIDKEWLCISNIDERLRDLEARATALESCCEDAQTRIGDLEDCCEDAQTRITNLEVGDVLRVLRVDNRLFMTSDGSTPVPVNP